jgi:hypothetical protein
VITLYNPGIVIARINYHQAMKGGSTTPRILHILILGRNDRSASQLAALPHVDFPVLIAGWVVFRFVICAYLRPSLVKYCHDYFKCRLWKIR